MKNTILTRLLSYFVIFSFLLIFADHVYAQIRLSDTKYEEVKDKDKLNYQPSAYPARIATPYIDILVGFSTFNDYGYSIIGISSEIRGGVRVEKSLLIGTGISIFTADYYEMAAMIPFEIGYRTKNEKFDLMSSIGYSYLLFQSHYRRNDIAINGRTFAIDAYWRPQLSYKRLRFVVAAGGIMYDYGNYSWASCNSCRNATGPHYTFRLRAGLGF